MFRSVFSVVRSVKSPSLSYINAARIISSNSSKEYKCFSTLTKICCSNGNTNFHNKSSNSLINNKQILELSKRLAPVPLRTVTKFSLKKGKRKTSKAVTRRFFRLDWGVWIRPRIGRHKRMWTKSAARKRRLRQHIMVNATQTTLLDKMVTGFWKKRKHYVDDPYEPYHTREEYFMTRKKPLVRE